ncbi:MAG: hypothetical protein IT225_00355, partial [Flavobacteriales bacterium]|nr:hypothetical protein [Flavobacteriales bacterium]
GTGNGSFAWSGPGGFASNDQNPTVNAAGIYTLTVTGANGCTSTATAEVSSDASTPYVSANGGTITCANPTVMLNANGAGSFSWVGPNGFTSNAQFPMVSEAGTYTVTITAANGCTNSASAEVTNNVSIPDVSAEGGMLPCEGGSVVLSVFTDGDAPSYTWSGPDGFTSNLPEPVVTTVGSYTVTVTTANGCSNSATVIVTRDDCNEKECPALITDCPGDITVDCMADLSPDALGWPTFRGSESDDLKKCPPVKNHGYWDETISTCPFVIRRTFWAMDMDGNVAYCEQLITLIDETGPVMYGLNGDGMNVGCDEDPENIMPPTVWAWDECTATIAEVEHEVSYEGDPTSGEGYSIVHTWTGVDLCGNRTVATWTLFVDCKKPDDKKSIVSAGPNPFRERCEVTLTPLHDGKAVVTITDLQGRQIKEAFNGEVHAGEPVRVSFQPEKVGTGTFLYHVRMDGEEFHGRIVHQP